MWFRWSSSVGNPLRSPGGGTKRWAKCAATGIGVALLPFMALTLVTDAPAQATGTTLYAYVGGGASSPTSCPQTTTVPSQCTLTQAIGLVDLATSGSTVYLATAGTSSIATHYVGNWAPLTGTALTIQPATGIFNPILDGTGSHGAVLTLHDVSLTATALTIEDGDNTSAGPAGGPSLGGGDRHLWRDDHHFGGFFQ